MNSLRTKLFLSLLGLTAVVLIITIGLARWSFSYGFADYRDSLEQERLGKMAERIAAIYLDNENQWNEVVLESYQRIYSRSLPSAGKVGGKPRNRDNRAEWREDGRPPPPHERPEFGRPPPPGPRNGGPPQPRHLTALLDNNGVLLAGDHFGWQNEKIIREPIVANAKTVGELVALAQRQFNTPEESTFSRQQLLASVLIAIFSLLLAGLASWLLSQTLLAPIFNIKQGVGSLARGDFGVALINDRQDELGTLTSDINALSRILEKNRSSRRRWLADISHELRTPVTILAGEIEAMQDGVREITEGSIASLASEIERLTRLIDDLYQLSLSDIGGIDYQLEQIDLSKVLEELTVPYINKAEAKGLTLSLAISGPALIDADRMRIEQLFSNLLNNSIAYTDAPGEISLQLIVNQDEVVVSLEDSLPGVDDAHLSLLFDPLYREDESRNGRSGGAGLGLTIGKNIVEAHSGKILALRSELGGVVYSNTQMSLN